MKYMIIYLTYLSLLGCNGNREEKYINQIVQEWTDKEIVFPENILVRVLDKDTTGDDLYSKRIKILVYIDSVGCTACKLNFYDWYEKICSLSDMDSLGFLFFVHSKNYKKFTNALKAEGFNYPVFYDKQNTLARINHFPKDQRFNTFLLDNRNKVRLIGNPLGKKAMWELYIKEIKRLTFIQNN